MTKCQAESFECYNKATWMIKYRVSHLGERTKFRRKICNQCYNVINPEHSNSLMVSSSNDMKQAMYMICDIVGVNMESWIESPMLVTFRPL